MGNKAVIGTGVVIGIALVCGMVAAIAYSPNPQPPAAPAEVLPKPISQEEKAIIAKSEALLNDATKKFQDLTDEAEKGLAKTLGIPQDRLKEWKAKGPYLKFPVSPDRSVRVYRKYGKIDHCTSIREDLVDGVRLSVFSMGDVESIEADGADITIWTPDSVERVVFLADEKRIEAYPVRGVSGSFRLCTLDALWIASSHDVTMRCGADYKFGEHQYAALRDMLSYLTPPAESPHGIRK